MKTRRISMKSLALIGTLVVCMAMAAVYLFLHTASAHTMKDNGFQIVAGSKTAFPKGTSFVYEEDGITYKGAKQQEMLTSAPIYYEQREKEILMPQSMVYCAGKQAILRATKEFSTFAERRNLTYEGKPLDGGFLFDGKNTYVFLESMELTINGKHIQTAPLSSITVNGSDAYFLYNTKDGEITMDHVYTDSVRAVHERYQLDLMHDILYTENKEKVLLYLDPDNLEELE